MRSRADGHSALSSRRDCAPSVGDEPVSDALLDSLEQVSTKTSAQSDQEEALRIFDLNHYGPMTLLDRGEPDPFATYPVEMDPQLRGELFAPASTCERSYVYD